MGKIIKLTEAQLKKLVVSNTQNIINEQPTPNQRLASNLGYGPVSVQYADKLATDGKLNSGKPSLASIASGKPAQAPSPVQGKPVNMPNGVPAMPSLKSALNPAKSTLGPVNGLQRQTVAPADSTKVLQRPPVAAASSNKVPAMPSLKDTLNPAKSTLGPLGKPAQTPAGTIQNKSAQTPAGTIQNNPAQAPPAAPRILAKPDPKVMAIQKQLKDAGYDLGTTGPNKDGIDGIVGRRTREAQKQMIIQKGQDSWNELVKKGQDLDKELRSKRNEINPNTGLPNDPVRAMRDKLPNSDGTDLNNEDPIDGEEEYMPNYELAESIKKIKEQFKRFL